MENCKSTTIPLSADEKLSKFDEAEKINASFYKSLIRKLLYLTATRQDLMFSANCLSKFMNSPSQKHLGAAKNVLRYFKGTIGYGIWYSREESDALQGNSYSDGVQMIARVLQDLFFHLDHVFLLEIQRSRRL